MYKLHTADPNEEQTARAITAVIDRLRARYGLAVLMEAHTPHGDSDRTRPARPFGSSLWRRWIDTGIGLRPIERPYRLCRLTCWKTRDERAWPAGLRAAQAWPWIPVDDTELRGDGPAGRRGRAA